MNLCRLFCLLLTCAHHFFFSLSLSFVSSSLCISVCVSLCVICPHFVKSQFLTAQPTQLFLIDASGCSPPSLVRDQVLPPTGRSFAKSYCPTGLSRWQSPRQQWPHQRQEPDFCLLEGQGGGLGLRILCCLLELPLSNYNKLIIS